MDVVDRAPEPAVLVVGMHVVHANKQSRLARRLPVLRSCGEVLVVWGRQAWPRNVGGSVGQLRPPMQADLGGRLRSRCSAVSALS